MTTLLILLAAAFVQAEVYPNYPAGNVLNSGTKCRVGWDGDKDSKTVWKDMSIQFMTGQNFPMTHLTTIATKLDGTVAGSFEWTCPEVTDNSAIYFYQFTSPKSVNTQWTTRFTIATKDGKTNAPPHALHPDGKPPAWGVGALKDPSKAVGPPVYTTAPATSTKAPVQTPTPGPTPTNVALGVKTGCTAFYTRTADQFCDGITAKFGITLAQFKEWNVAGVCELLVTGNAYCVSHSGTVTPPKTTTAAGPAQATPTNVADGVKAGCTAFYTRKDLLCSDIIAQFGITSDNFKAWNRDNVCTLLENGKAYCVGHSGTPVTKSLVPTATATVAPQATPTNAATGIKTGCTKFYTRTNTLCTDIATQFGISVKAFQAWNRDNVCTLLENGKAYCVANGSISTSNAPSNVADGVKAGCTEYYTRQTLNCVDIVAKFGITLADFQSWNRDNVCTLLENGKAYCVSHAGVSSRGDASHTTDEDELLLPPVLEEALQNIPDAIIDLHEDGETTVVIDDEVIEHALAEDPVALAELKEDGSTTIGEDSEEEEEKVVEHDDLAAVIHDIIKEDKEKPGFASGEDEIIAVIKAKPNPSQQELVDHDDLDAAINHIVKTDADKQIPNTGEDKVIGVIKTGPIDEEINIVVDDELTVAIDEILDLPTSSTGEDQVLAVIETDPEPTSLAEEYEDIALLATNENEAIIEVIKKIARDDPNAIITVADADEPGALDDSDGATIIRIMGDWDDDANVACPAASIVPWTNLTSTDGSLSNSTTQPSTPPAPAASQVPPTPGSLGKI